MKMASKGYLVDLSLLLLISTCILLILTPLSCDARSKTLPCGSSGDDKNMNGIWEEPRGVPGLSGRINHNRIKAFETIGASPARQNGPGGSSATNGPIKGGLPPRHGHPHGRN